MKMKLQMKQTFTLIELLVVIAIIAILASLLLPSLSKAQARAKTTQCTGNIKQVVLANLSYMDDNNDIRINDHTYSNSDSWWSKVFYDANYLTTRQVMNCPALPIQYKSENWSRVYASPHATYSADLGVIDMKNQRYTAITPSKLLLFADAVEFSTARLPSYRLRHPGSDGTSYGHIALIHSSETTATIALADGHAQQAKMADFIGTGSTNDGAIGIWMSDAGKTMSPDYVLPLSGSALVSIP